MTEVLEKRNVGEEIMKTSRRKYFGVDDQKAPDLRSLKNIQKSYQLKSHHTRTRHHDITDQ